MDAFKRIWQSGYEGQHIEELISGVFSDFAPYAGAEHQRLSLIRQYDTCAATGVTVEETGDLVFNVGYAGAGTTVFTTTGLLQVDANLKVPLPPVPYTPPPPPRQSPPTTGAATAAALARASLPSSPLPPPSSSRSENGKQAATGTYSVSDVKRFVSTVRGAQLFFGIPTASRLPLLPAAKVDGHSDPRTFGQLELEGAVPALWDGRTALGLRAGPLAARLSRSRTAVEVPLPSPENSQDEATSVKEGGAAVVYTLDASLCVPVAELLSDAGQAGQQGGGEAAERNPLAVTLGVQHPFSATLPVAGDTLVGVAVQSDRGISEAYQTHAIDRPREEEGRMRFPAPQANTFRLLVVQTLLSATSAGAGAGGPGGSSDGSGLLSGTSPSRSTSRMQNTSGSSNDNATGGGGERSWYSLPTLVGCHASFQQQLLRLSVASIFHDGDVDVEAAAVVDATPLLPRTPTLLKLGWNNTGRLALGITSLFYNALSVTLGVHVTPGEDMRFGLEIKV